MAKKKVFPEVLYAKWEQEGTDGEWLNAESDPDELVQAGENVRVARYVLGGYTILSATVSIQDE